jgi:hypothetical protein
MIRCGRVAPDVWLGFAWDEPVIGLPAGAARWRRDREAGRRAVAAVVEASGGRDRGCATSRAHTWGIAAAVAAPAGTPVGVDLVRADRVSVRHAETLLADEEWAALAPYGTLLPPLAWALKEAAAKASGDPLTCFPHGLRIERGPCGLVVLGRLRLVAGWGLFGRFLYGWVAAPTMPSRLRRMANLQTG